MLLPAWLVLRGRTAHGRGSRSIYNYFRDYDPYIGRYLEESDPLGPRSGANTYAYVLNNMISRIDPPGRKHSGNPVL